MQRWINRFLITQIFSHVREARVFTKLEEAFRQFYSQQFVIIWTLGDVHFAIHFAHDSWPANGAVCNPAHFNIRSGNGQ